jgi:hypothetical protein
VDSREWISEKYLWAPESIDQREIPVGSREHGPVRNTCGLQRAFIFLINLRALMYSVWIICAADTRSPSHLLTTTTSATSTIPFFIPEIRSS